MDGKIVQLDRSHQEETIQVLASAFASYQMMEYIYSVSKVSIEESLRAMFRVSCDIRYEFDWPVLGVLDAEEKIVGVALLDLEKGLEWPESLRQKHNTYKQIVGAEAAARMDEYGRLAETGTPPQPHIKLSVIGVLPGMQGKGYGGKLLDETHRISENNPDSIGVWLDTETKNNVALYQRFGYEVKAHSTLEEVNIWGMFRPNKD